MNVFVLNQDPKLSALDHLDRHIVKMPLESAQLLCTALHLNDISAPYKPTHKNHPCAVWVRQSLDNFVWCVEYGLSLCAEYTHRYSKVHKSQAVIDYCFQNLPELPDIGLTSFVQAMPDVYKRDDAVEAYRAYYQGDKAHMAKWTNRDVPD